MAKIYLRDFNKTIESNGKSNLLEILLNNDIPIENPCNGKKTCFKCKVKIKSAKELPINLEEQQALSDAELNDNVRLACFTNLDEDDEIEIEVLFKETKHRVLTSGKMPFFAMQLQEGYGLAIDIGTTTIALTLVALNTGQQIASSSKINSQKQYGLDVLTRITYEYNNPDDGIAILQKAVVNDLNELIEEVCLKTRIDRDKIIEVSVAANTTMLHMLLAVDARSIGKAPYQPQFISAQKLKAIDIGLELSKKTILYCLPSVSSYVGADIVAGAYVCQLKQKNNTTLFIDIGTNGEIILVNDGKLTCCSCAAGPALEGMNISSGMRAAEGAIEEIEIQEDEILIKTIGTKQPQGLCGSGILSAIKELLRVGIVKKNGAFIKKDALAKDDYRQKFIRMNENKREFIIHNNPEIIVSMNDVRQVQLAKGALLSGFMALLNKAQLKLEDIDEVIVAGQFGSHLSIDILIGTGILPNNVEDKINYVGNSSSTGAYMALMSHQVKKEMEELANEIEYMELAESEDYEKLFTKCLIFPDKEEVSN